MKPLQTMLNLFIVILILVLVGSIAWFAISKEQRKHIDQQIKAFRSETPSKINEAEKRVHELEHYISRNKADQNKLNHGIVSLEDGISEYNTIIDRDQAELAFIKVKLENGEPIRTASSSPRVLSSDEIADYVAKKTITINTAQQGIKTLESEMVFLRDELAKREMEARTAPLQLLELKGSLANLRLVYDLYKDRLDMIDDYRTPDAAALYAEARNSLDDAFSRFDNNVASVEMKIDMSEISAPDPMNASAAILRSIDDALGITKAPEGERIALEVAVAGD